MQTISFKKVGEWVVIVLVLVWCAVLTARPIDLSTADLGRHLTNGFVLVHGSWQDKWAVLHTNFYSYTNQNAPFVNHHWATGVVFYVVQQWFGFAGLSIFYVVLTLLTFLIFFRIAQRQFGSAFAVLLAVLVLPIITSRKEVRPEIFSYLFCGLYYWLLLQWQDRRFESNDLKFKNGLPWLVPVIMLFWVNLHIEFIVGFGIVGVFWLWELILLFRKQQNHLRFLSIILIATLVAALCNPSGIYGLLYPFVIFHNYGYMIVENQSVLFLMHRHFGNGLYFGYFWCVLGVVLVSFLWVLIKLLITRGRKFIETDRMGQLFINFILMLTFGVLATLAIRDFPLFGLFALPAVSYNFHLLLPTDVEKVYKKILWAAAAILALGIVLRIYLDVHAAGEQLGVGLMTGESGAANFYLSNNIQGPVFNDYDIGGYLIYYLYPHNQSVFVDNRPEAYTTAFFQTVYIPAQEDPKAFAALDKQYHFNSIFFYWHDATPWAQQFLVGLVQNSNWAPVYVDNYNIIFLKRSSQNSEIIKLHELPKSMFGVISQ